MSDTLVYTSKSSVKCLWQEYGIYEDRLEFGTLFGQMTIPFEQVESVEVSESVGWHGHVFVAMRASLGLPHGHEDVAMPPGPSRRAMPARH
jgi:hypothetical protein